MDTWAGEFICICKASLLMQEGLELRVGRERGYRMRAKAWTSFSHAAMFWQGTSRSPRILNSNLNFQVVLKVFLSK